MLRPGRSILLAFAALIAVSLAACTSRPTDDERAPSPMGVRSEPERMVVVDDFTSEFVEGGLRWWLDDGENGSGFVELPFASVDGVWLSAEEGVSLVVGSRADGERGRLGLLEFVGEPGDVSLSPVESVDLPAGMKPIAVAFHRLERRLYVLDDDRHAEDGRQRPWFAGWSGIGEPLPCADALGCVDVSDAARFVRVDPFDRPDLCERGVFLFDRQSYGICLNGSTSQRVWQDRDGVWQTVVVYQ